MAAQDVTELTQSINKAKENRDRLKRNLDELVSQPFFAQHSDKNNNTRLMDLQAQIEAREKKNREAKAATLFNEEEKNKLIK